MIDPYNAATHGETKVAVGAILWYHNQLRTYDVNVIGHGQVLAKQLYAGVDKPYGRGTRVVLTRCSGTDWFIVGELPTAGAGGQQRSGEPVDLAEVADLAANRTRLTAPLTPDAARDYTDVDSSGQAGPVVNEGDVRIESGTANQLAKSFLHMRRGGDILMSASNACYVLFSRFKRSIIVRALNLFENIAGFTRRIETRALGNRYATTYTSTIRNDPLQDIPDIQVRAGYVNDTDIDVGAEVRYEGGYIQLAHKKACRIKFGDIWFVLGDLSKTAETPFEGTGTGVQIHTTKGVITISDDTEHIRLALQNGTTSVDIGPIGVSVAQADARLTVSSGQVTLAAPSVQIAAAETLDIVAGSSIKLTAPSIDLN